MKNGGCKIEVTRLPWTLQSSVAALIDERLFLDGYRREVVKDTIDKISTEVAKIFLEHHRDELVHMVDMHTVASEVNKQLGDRMMKALTEVKQ